MGKPKLDMIHPGKSEISYAFPNHSFSFLCRAKASHARNPTLPSGTTYSLSLSGQKGNVPIFLGTQNSDTSFDLLPV